MNLADEALADLAFSGPVIEWRGPAPFFFVAVPAEQADALRYAARLASYGWGVVPVTARANGIDFRTALFPRDGTYWVPLKAAVRRQGAIMLGQEVQIRLLIYPAARNSFARLPPTK